jgi:hypothetical protein
LVRRGAPFLDFAARRLRPPIVISAVLLFARGPGFGAKGPGFGAEFAYSAHATGVTVAVTVAAAITVALTLANPDPDVQSADAIGPGHGSAWHGHC